MTTKCEDIYYRRTVDSNLDRVIEAIRCELPGGHYIDHVARSTDGEVVEWLKSKSR